MADREADIYDLFVEAPCPETAADWLVRGQHDRVLANGKTLRQHVAEAPVLAATTFERPASHGCKARTVHQELRAVRITLPAPRRPDRTLPAVDITALLASEPAPPTGEEPVVWLLLTNLPVDTPAQALEKLQWYLCRWQIEIYQSWCLRKAIIQRWRRCRRWRRAPAATSGGGRRDGLAGAPIRRRRPAPATGGDRPARPGGPAANLCATS